MKLFFWLFKVDSLASSQDNHIDFEANT